MSLHQLAQLFKPRDPVEYLKPYPEQIGKKRPLPYTGVAWCVSALESKEEYEEIMQTWKPIEQRKERRIRVASERKESSAVKVQEALERWNPSGYVFDSDAYKTLFVGRLSYLTDEHKLKREMEQVLLVLHLVIHYFQLKVKLFFDFLTRLSNPVRPC
jgi:hypothetical protein